MKVYRVMPDSFYLKNYLSGNNTAFEDIFYKMGYISFREENKHSYNTIYKKLSSDEKKFGKYFFLFVDDALWHGLFLLKSFHCMRIDTFMIVEYEIPDELVLKHIGYGDYSKSAFKELVLECFVTKSDLEGLKISSLNLKKEEKEQALLNSFKSSLDTVIKYDEAAWDQLEFYKELFNAEELNQIVSDNDLLSKELLNSSLCDSFVNSDYEIIKTPFITSRIIYINRFVDKFNVVAEKLEPIGTRFENYEEKEFFKKQLLFYSDKDTAEAKEKMEVLLKSKGYMS